MKEVKGKTNGTKSTVVQGNKVTCQHVTLHKATDTHWQLTTTFDFEGVSQDTILKLASETLVIRWRTAFKGADKVDETADNQVMSVAKMLKGSKPRMSKGEKMAKLLADMSPEEKKALLAHLASMSGTDVVLPDSEEGEQELDSEQDDTTEE